MGVAHRYVTSDQLALMSKACACSRVFNRKTQMWRLLSIKGCPMHNVICADCSHE